ncbi:pyridoxamine 5'-phosphate oxidase family protein [Methanocella arvoryzae]|uniref:Pyridoxamine 5\'-phosphate-related protein n=1 Tax=Methanocella arvoryzae (strain DSM 22066 / NBRC 105507 / MRE50) TaxID=351160 RepID=Q0W6X8_METAR|nr:pyridoxamine 5'-phosphate oxidase family protein [Methanocella arvoryzae]CAJ35865.1 putative pyridoxamine 5\'-phosphate-related protein [Methanocella arvoryzae MRE50]
MKLVSSDRKRRGMSLDAITDFLNSAPVGRMATINPDGTPYVLPLHFAFEDDRIYVHCALEGKKLDNLRRNPAVCFEADEVLDVQIVSEKPCASGTYYRSVIANGQAAIVDDPARKRHILQVLMDKYAWGRKRGEMSDEAIDETCVVEIMVEEISGKARLP